MRGHVQRLGFISSYVPKKCGIATFSRDLIEGMLANRPNLQVAIEAAETADEDYSYLQYVINTLKTNKRSTYKAAARDLNALNLDAVFLQHEYGLYGGDWVEFTQDGIEHRDPTGNYIFDLINDLKAPLITTLHTVLPKPDEARKAVIQELSEKSKMMVTMTQDSKRMLIEKYEINSSKVVVIPHGVPKAPQHPRSKIHAKLGLDPTNFYLVITGLIGPNKGIDLVIKALPDILKNFPNVRLLVVGQTHPGILAHEGEKYRKKLHELAEKLSVGHAVSYINKYIPTNMLMDYMAASDIYLTIHRDPEQSASGTLAYAVGNGLLALATPYRYAQELLSRGRGFIVPFEDPKSITKTVNDLLGNQALRKRTIQKLQTYCHKMEWNTVSNDYLLLADRFSMQPVSI